MKRRYTSRQAIEKIRRWVNEETDSDTDNSSENEIADDECQPDVQNPDVDSGSETEDYVAESNSADESSNDDEQSEPDVASDEGELSGDERSDSSNHYQSGSGMIWKSTVPPSSKTKQANIVRAAAGPNAAVQNKTDPVDIYRMFMTPVMMSQILQYTNAEGKRRADSKQPPNNSWSVITSEELDAAFGLLYLCGIFGMS